MTCTGCGFAAPSEFAFCPKCGKQLARACISCGFNLAAEFKFCPKCGQSQDADRTDAASSRPTDAARSLAAHPSVFLVNADTDRRLVTVIFADLCGFTSLSEQLDPEQVLALQRDLFGEFAGAVEGLGGHVDKVMGDGLLALFGAPAAHEDDPERALACALALFERLRHVAARWPLLPRPLELHVGVNTGPVAAGAVGPRGVEAYSVSGDTVNSAARLQGLAEPGQILVGPATYRLARHAFAFEPLGRLTIRGRVAALDAYLLTGALPARRSSRGLETLGITAPMVGREAELGRMMAAFNQMRAGAAQIVRLVGEAGAGKTRLVTAFLDRLRTEGHLDGVTVRRAAATQLDSRGYGVMAAILRDGYGITPDEPVKPALDRIMTAMREIGLAEDEITRLAPVVSLVLTGTGSEGTSCLNDPEQVRRQIIFAVRTMMEQRLAHEPVLFVVEDVHWADAASVELLKLLTDRLWDRHLMILLTHRPDFDARVMVTARASQSALRLTQLDDATAQSLFDALFGSSAASLPKALKRLVVERAGGNPLHLEEIVRGLVDDGVLVHEGGVWRAEGNAAALPIPLSLQGLLLARIDRLPRGMRSVIQEAAVLGILIEARHLKQMSAIPAETDAILDRLLDGEYLEELPRSRGSSDRVFRFRHALVREVIYENMLMTRRERLHLAAAEALEKLTGGSQRKLEYLISLGRHFGLGGNPQRGAGFLVEAGDFARDVYANDDALKLYQDALDFIDRVAGTTAERLAIGERLADLLTPAGRRAEALEHYESAYRAFAALGDKPSQARLCRKIAAVHWAAGERDRALERCRGGLALLDSAPRHIEVAHHYDELGRLMFRTGDYASAAQWAERALTYIEEMIGEGVPNNGNQPDPQWRREAARIVSHAQNTLGVALARQRRMSEAVACVERGITVAEDHGLMDAALRGYSNLGVLYTALDPRRAIESCRKGLTVARKIGDLGFEARLYANLAVACCTFTDRCSEEGLAAAERALDLDQRLDLRDHLAVPLTVLAQIHHCHGDPEEAFHYYFEALDVAQEIGEAQLLFPCYDGLAVLYLNKGEEEQAEKYFRKAQDVCARAGVEADSLVVLPFLA